MVRQFSAGGVVYKKIGDQVLFLLRRSSTSNSSYYASGTWSLPKGWLDDAGPNLPGPLTLGQKRATSEEVQQTALREVREETGVEAQIISRLGDVKYFFNNEQHEKVFKTVIFFLMEYISDLPEGFGVETSETAWLPVDEAVAKLKKLKGEAELITKAQTLI